MPFQPGTSNRTALRYVKETNFNETPATPALKNIRYTGETLAFTPNSITSAEIRADRMTADLVQVGASVAGDINFEMSYGTFDELIAAALASTWGAPVSNTATIKNGVELQSFTIQKHFQDLSAPVFQNFRGNRIGGMSLNFQTGQILTGTFNVMGCAAASSTSQITGAVITSPGQSSEPMNAVSHLTAITKNGVAMAAKMRTLSLTLTNNLRGQEAIGTLGYVGIALGRLEITGNIELYFEDPSEYNTFLGNTAFALAFTLQDTAGNKYVITLPRVKYESGTITSGGLDQDLVVTGTWRALFDSTTSCMIQIARTPSA